MWVSLIIWCIAARFLCFFVLLLNKKNQLFFYGKCICLSFTISLQKNPTTTTKQTKQILILQKAGVAACQDVHPSVAAGRTHVHTHSAGNLPRCCIYLGAVKGGQCGFSGVCFLFCFVFLRSRRQEVELWCWLVCDSSVCGGSRGCISSCLASERVKGSGREA